MVRPPLRLILAEPRGFCAGVARAIEIVEKLLLKHGAPVFVRHEIVHNRFVVQSLEAQGAVFVDELDQVPDGVPVVFSAHGVPKQIPKEAERRNLHYIDATCPLVSKVHRECERHFRDGRLILMIGHKGHPEVIGTFGQLPKDAMRLIESKEDARDIQVENPENLAYVTQTTLSVDDTKQIIAVLKDRFPAIFGPIKEDICYATTNRQQAVKEIAPDCDAVLVVGAPNSSNSLRLVEVASHAGCNRVQLVQSADDIDWAELDGLNTVGLTASASAPEFLVEEIVKCFQSRYDLKLKHHISQEENVVFKLPRSLAASHL